MWFLNMLPNIVVGYALGALFVYNPFVAVLGLIGSFFLKSTLDFKSKYDTIKENEETSK